MKKKTLRNLINEWLKKLLTPIVREVIAEREAEIIEFTSKCRGE